MLNSYIQHVKSTCHGHHKDAGGITWENGARVLLTDQPTADEHDQRLGWASPMSDRQTALQTAAEFLGEIAAWFAGADTIHSCGLRGFALALLLKPDMLPARNRRNAVSSDLARSPGTKGVGFGQTQESVFSTTRQVSARSLKSRRHWFAGSSGRTFCSNALTLPRPR